MISKARGAQVNQNESHYPQKEEHRTAMNPSSESPVEQNYTKSASITHEVGHRRSQKNLQQIL